MALIPAISKGLLRTNNLQFLREYSSRSLIPFLWDFDLSPRRRRNDFGFGITPEDLWNARDPFDFFFPEVNRFTGYQKSPWASGIEKNATINKDGLQLCFDVRHFAPNEISVKIVDNTILVEGKHEERSDGEGYASRHFTRRYELPEGYSIKDVVSTLSSDGILTVKAPVKEATIDESKVHHVQIQQTGPAHLNVNEKEDTAKTIEGEGKSEQKPDSDKK